MPDQDDTTPNKNQSVGFASFAVKRIVIAVVLITIAIWALGALTDLLKPSGSPPLVKKTALPLSLNEGKENPLAASNVASENSPSPQAETKEISSVNDPHQTAMAEEGDTGQAVTAYADKNASVEAANLKPGLSAADKEGPIAVETKSPAAAPKTALDAQAEGQPTPNTSAHAAPDKPAMGNNPVAAPGTSTHAPEPAHPAPGAGAHAAPEIPERVNVPVGVIFVEAVIRPLGNELNKRWWGWRPNDLINLTDNVNNIQLGVLEVTRRSAVQLSERISRTGITDALNRHLENAVNWLMVSPDRYWFPSPESKYQESLNELKAYIEQLMTHRASFYIRSDNIIPLLSSYVELLGSCDENLVKQKNEDGSAVSHFQADDYFYYAKGVAGAMATILEAVHHDFAPTLENRNGIELLHHAIASCRQAAALEPLLVTNSGLDGILANHRANIAAPISHARFFIGQLIQTLST